MPALRFDAFEKRAHALQKFRKHSIVWPFPSRIGKNSTSTTWTDRVQLCRQMKLFLSWIFADVRCCQPCLFTFAINNVNANQFTCNFRHNPPPLSGTPMSIHYRTNIQYFVFERVDLDFAQAFSATVWIMEWFRLVPGIVRMFRIGSTPLEALDRGQ